MHTACIYFCLRPVDAEIPLRKPRPGAGGEGPEDGAMPADSTELPEDGTDPTTTMADKGTEESWRTGTAPVRGAGTGTTAAHPDEPPTDTVADRTSGASAAPALAEGGVAPEDVRSDGDSLHTAGAAQRHVVERGNGKHELDWVTDWCQRTAWTKKQACVEMRTAVAAVQTPCAKDKEKKVEFAEDSERCSSRFGHLKVEVHTPSNHESKWNIGNPGITVQNKGPIAAVMV